MDGWMEVGGGVHIIISSSPPQPNLFSCPQTVGTLRSRVAVFSRLSAAPLSPDGVSEAASPPPLLGSSAATSLAGGISTFAPPPSPPSVPPFLPRADSRAPVNGQVQRVGGA